MGKTLIHSLAEFKRLQALDKPDAPAAAPPKAAASPGRAPARPAPPGPSPTPLDEPDRALFRQAMRHVRPLPDRGPRARARPRREPESWLQARRQHAQGSPAPHDSPRRVTQAPPEAPLRPHTAVHDPDARAFLQAGCGTDLLRNLRRGKWPIQATLDLHGSHLDQAMERLDRFLVSCLDHGIRSVRIIHGKGMGSRSGTAVLKAAVRSHLGRLAPVQAWAECAERDGGAGAVMVLLRLPEN